MKNDVPSVENFTADNGPLYCTLVEVNQETLSEIGSLVPVANPHLILVLEAVQRIED